MSKRQKTGATSTTKAVLFASASHSHFPGKPRKLPLIKEFTQLFQRVLHRTQRIIKEERAVRRSWSTQSPWLEKRKWMQAPHHRHAQTNTPNLANHKKKEALVSSFDLLASKMSTCSSLHTCQVKDQKKKSNLDLAASSLIIQTPPP